MLYVAASRAAHGPIYETLLEEAARG